MMLKLTLTTLTLTFVTNVFGFSAWNSSNRPELFEDSYERSFEQLATSGQLTKRPWSGNYWATHTGGINFRWNKKLKVSEEHERYSYDIPSYDDLASAGVPVKFMSPSEKYDIFIGRKSFDLVKYERNRTKVMKTVEGSEDHDKSFEIPTWEGLCHAWAPATLAYDNIGPVTLTNKDGIEVQFGSSDVKALLTYHLHMNRAPKTKFLGSRCRLDFKELKEKVEKGEITQEEYDTQINSAECADTNAGAFHIVLTNQIAKMDQGFIVDITRDAEVWNQAVYKFATKELSRKSGATEGAAPGTVEEVTVETKLTYIVEVYQRSDSEITDASLRTDTFQYRLELNNRGKIIGGEWLGEDRPDFIWKSTNPKFQGYFAKLEGIYNAAVASAQNEETEREFLKERMEERDRIRAQAEAQENASINSDNSMTALKKAAVHLNRSAKHLQNQLAHDFDPELTEVEMSAQEIAAIDSVIEITALTTKLSNHLSSRSASRNTTISILNEMIGKINAAQSALNAIKMTSHQREDYNHFIGMVNRIIKIVRGESVSIATSPSPSAHHTDSVHFDTETSTPDVDEEEARGEEERREEEARAEEERREEEARAEEERREEEARAEEERRREEARREEERRRNNLNLSGLSAAQKISKISSKMRMIGQDLVPSLRNSRGAYNQVRLLMSGLSRLKSATRNSQKKSQVEAIDYTLKKLMNSVRSSSIRTDLKTLRSLSKKMMKAAKELPQDSYRRPGRRYGPGRRR